MKGDATASDLESTVAIPATPFAYRLASGRTALVIIDMQRDFVEPGGFGRQAVFFPSYYSAVGQCTRCRNSYRTMV